MYSSESRNGHWQPIQSWVEINDFCLRLVTYFPLFSDGFISRVLLFYLFFFSSYVCMYVRVYVQFLSTCVLTPVRAYEPALPYIATDAVPSPTFAPDEESAEGS